MATASEQELLYVDQLPDDRRDAAWWIRIEPDRFYMVLPAQDDSDREDEDYQAEFDGFVYSGGWKIDSTGLSLSEVTHYSSKPGEFYTGTMGTEDIHSETTPETVPGDFVAKWDGNPGRIKDFSYDLRKQEATFVVTNIEGDPGLNTYMRAVKRG